MVIKQRRTLLIRLAISAALLLLILLTAPYLNAQEEQPLIRAGLSTVEPAEPVLPLLFSTPNNQ